VERKRKGSAEQDAIADIKIDQLLGASVEVYFDHYGWSKGKVSKADKLKCTIKYDDDGSTEDVELPDDTIRICSYN